jgi:hypothetical protein
MGRMLQETLSGIFMETNFPAALPPVQCLQQVSVQLRAVIAQLV